jgi:asparagine synthase (glutamine-hydrolysing)
MCGIFGIVTTRGQGEVAEIVQRAVGRLSHRGPDDEGIEIIVDEERGLTIGLAHRRLAILDLTVAGHQPMVDELTGNRIVYNGEVFNFQELRQGMESSGTIFRSESDTEVVLKSFGRSGERWAEAVTPWRGMFAFGLWNRVDGTLSLVRDRLGIKPLYYHLGDDFIVFASEIRSLLASGLVPRRLSRVAVESFLSQGSVEGPLTILDEVFAVLPGHHLRYRAGRVESIPYWPARLGNDRVSIDYEETTREVRELTRDAVRLWTVADVPISIFLSGGIDSSALVSLLHQSGIGDLRTFSVSFPEAEYNEQLYAETVARKYGTQHTSVMLSEQEALERVPRAMRALDQPSIDGINTWIVAEATAAAGLKVALSGLGGDEVFLGYNFYRTLTRDEKLRQLAAELPVSLCHLAGRAIRFGARSASGVKLGELLESNELELHTVRLRRQLFSQRQRCQLLGDAPDLPNDKGARQMLEERRDRQSTQSRLMDPLNQASALELGGYLTNTLLRDTDVMSMAHGLEVRVPFLDHLLIERLWQIPGEMKLGKGPGLGMKWLLAQAAGDLPGEILERRKKGFELPFHHWLSGALQPLAEEMLERSRSQGILDQQEVESVWESFLGGRTTWSRVWALIILTHWIDVNLGVDEDYGGV